MLDALCDVSSSLLVEKRRARYRSLNAIPVRFEISNRSSTTGFIKGIPSLLRIASASLSGSPGEQRTASARSRFGFTNCLLELEVSIKLSFNMFEGRAFVCLRSEMTY